MSIHPMASPTFCLVSIEVSSLTVTSDCSCLVIIIIKRFRFYRNLLLSNFLISVLSLLLLLKDSPILSESFDLVFPISVTILIIIIITDREVLSVSIVIGVVAVVFFSAATVDTPYSKI